MPLVWSFEYEGERFTEDEVTFDQASRVQKMTGLPWGGNPIASVESARAFAAVLFADRTGKTMDDVLSAINGMSALKFAQSLRLETVGEDDEPDPPEGSEEP